MGENPDDNPHGYQVVQDVYCYPGTNILINKNDLRSENDLCELEKAMTFARSSEVFPDGDFSVAHYCTIHHHLFQDVYEWAGRFRTVRIAKDETAFCFPEHLSDQMHLLFSELREKEYLTSRSKREFAAQAAWFLAELNALHPFREGNGRAQSLFLALLAVHAGYPLDMERLDPDAFRSAMIQSFHGNRESLTDEIEKLI